MNLNFCNNPSVDSEQSEIPSVLDQNKITKRWSRITHDVLSPLINTDDGQLSQKLTNFSSRNSSQADTIRGHIAALLLINSEWKECAVIGKMFFGESIETKKPLDFGEISAPLTITPLFTNIINTLLGEAVLRSYLQKFCFSSSYVTEEIVAERQRESFALVTKTFQQPGTRVDVYRESQIEQLLLAGKTVPKRETISAADEAGSSFGAFYYYNESLGKIRQEKQNRKEKLIQQAGEFLKKLNCAKEFVESLLLSLSNDSIDALAEPISRILKLQSLFQTASDSRYDWEIERESYLKSDNTLMCKAVREFLLLRTGYRDYEECQFSEESLITSSSENIRIFENLMKYYKFFIRNLSKL